MATKIIYEATDPLRLLDTEDGVWRAKIRETTGPIYYPEKEGYEKGDVVQFSTQQYIDADRAGVCGYFGHAVQIPLVVLLEVADAIRANQVPREKR